MISVPVGHDGFKDRADAIPYPHTSVGENVAMNYGHGSPPRVAVDGWIKSPGHRKNVGNWCCINFNFCFLVTRMLAKLCSRSVPISWRKVVFYSTVHIVNTIYLIQRDSDFYGFSV